MTLVDRDVNRAITPTLPSAQARENADGRTSRSGDRPTRAVRVRSESDAEVMPAINGGDPAPSAEGARDAATRPQIRYWRVRRLMKQLDEYRLVLAPAWSINTVHPWYPVTPDKPASHGQCGVSSAWLMRRLSWSWRIRARYCHGDILFDNGESGKADFHCWIEIGRSSSSRRLIVDVTCDQFEVFRNILVLCERHGGLVRRSIEYKATTRMRLKELEGDDVWSRLRCLEEVTGGPPRRAIITATTRHVPISPRAVIARVLVAARLRSD